MESHTCVCKGPGVKSIVCPHVYKFDFEEGIKRFTGRGLQAAYLCKVCDSSGRYIKRYRCAACVQDLEIDFDWSIKGGPAILRNPKCFRFSMQELAIPKLADTAILSMAPLPNHPTDLLLYTEDSQLWKLNLHSGDANVIGSYHLVCGYR